MAVTDPINRRTSYTYDSMRNITTVTDVKLHVTKYTYDLENNLTSRTTPMGRTEQYVRDAARRLTQRVIPFGNAIHYDYDTLNGLMEKTYHNVGELGNDHPVQMGGNEMGQRVSMEDITGESSYTYDGLGCLKTATNFI